MNGKPINLRRWRKRRRREAEKVTADENAARHGQSGAVRRLQASQAEKVARDLDGHKLDDADE